MDADPVATLAEFESGMSVDNIQLFQQRFDNGYDLDHDCGYNHWKKLREETMQTEGGL